MISHSKSGPNTAEWIKTRETTHEISSGNAAAGIKSSADEYAENKTRRESVDVEDIIIDQTQKDFDSAKSGVARVWDQTKDMAENICDAVKHGAEAGWNKVTGD